MKKEPKKLSQKDLNEKYGQSVRLSKEVLEFLRKQGEFRDSWDVLIRRVLKLPEKK